MFAVLRAEWLRLKGVFVPLFLTVLPASIVVLVTIMRYLAPNATVWSYYLWMLFNWWPLIWVPFGIAILAAHSMMLDKPLLRGLRSRPVSPALLYLGKLLVLAIHFLASSLLLIALTLLSGVLLLKGATPWGTVITASLLIWVTALPLVALMLWFALLGGYVLPIVVSLVGPLSGAVMAVQSSWMLNPWAWPLRVVIPVVGVHPNGVPLEAGDPLLQTPMVPVVLVSLIAFILFAALGAVWFVRQEVKA